MTDTKNLMNMFTEFSKTMGSQVQKIEKERVTAESGGGLVKLTLNGTGKVLELKVDPLLYQSDNKAHLEQLVIAAFNDGREQCNKLAQQHTQSSILENMPNPFEMLSKKE